MSRRRTRPPETAAPGQDSFLDIVANLVGILIILVIVVGIRTKDALVEASNVSAAAETAADAAEPAPVVEQQASPISDTPTSDDADNLDAPIDVESARAAAASVEQSILELNEKLQRQSLEVDYRRRERDRMQVLITVAEKELAEQQQRLSQEKQSQLEQQQLSAEGEQQLQRLKTQLEALDNATAPVERLDHLPTPMAKTVFGTEVHLRLQGGRLAYVPWDELVEKLKEDAPNRVWQLKEAPRITETIGPFSGFRLRYTLKKTEQMVRTDAGVGMQQRVELDFFHLVPVESNLGEPVADALASSNSQLQNLAGSSDPKSTTFTIWVYPDSFEEFRELKQWLFQRGFLTASRPMPEGRLIGGAPDGSRSASQ